MYKNLGDDEMVNVVDRSIKFVCRFTGTRAFNLLGKDGDVTSRIVQFGSRSSNHIIQVNAKPTKIKAIQTFFNKGRCTGVRVKTRSGWSEKAEPSIFKDIKRLGTNIPGFVMNI